MSQWQPGPPPVGYPYGGPVGDPQPYGGPAAQPHPYGGPTGYPPGHAPGYAPGGYAPAPQWAMAVPPGFVPFGGAVVPLASWGKRVGAYLLDGLVPGVPITVGYGVMAIAMIATIDPVTGEPDGPASAVGLIACLLLWVVGLVLNGWNRWFRQGRTGQSWGKSVVGIRLVGQTGFPVGAGMAFLRDLAHYLDGAVYVGYLWPLWDARRQTFADKVCSTYVVDGGPA